MNIQPFTYDRIKTNSWITGGSLATPHGVGHGWDSVLWDMTWNLVDRHGFNDNIYDPWNAGGNNRSLQYVTDGLKMQGCAPGFVAGRDGILAATRRSAARTPACVWSTFARRGLGVQRRAGHDQPRRQHRGVRHPGRVRRHGGRLRGPEHARAARRTCSCAAPGTRSPMPFSLGGNRGLDVLAGQRPRDGLAADRLRHARAPLQFAITTPDQRRRRAPRSATTAVRAPTPTSGTRTRPGPTPAASSSSPSTTARSTGSTSSSSPRTDG